MRWAAWRVKSCCAAVDPQSAEDDCCDLLNHYKRHSLSCSKEDALQHCNLFNAELCFHSVGFPLFFLETLNPALFYTVFTLCCYVMLS